MVRYGDEFRETGVTVSGSLLQQENCDSIAISIKIMILESWWRQNRDSITKMDKYTKQIEYIFLIIFHIFFFLKVQTSTHLTCLNNTSQIGHSCWPNLGYGGDGIDYVDGK